jgi:hypothetical protein
MEQGKVVRFNSTYGFILRANTIPNLSQSLTTTSQRAFRPNGAASQIVGTVVAQSNPLLQPPTYREQHARGSHAEQCGG